MVCGAQGNPGTVAPFRAWRGSRDLVAQSPKLHSPAAARFIEDKAMLREKSLAQALRVTEVPSRDVRDLRESLWRLQRVVWMGNAMTGAAGTACRIPTRPGLFVS